MTVSGDETPTLRAQDKSSSSGVVISASLALSVYKPPYFISPLIAPPGRLDSFSSVNYLGIIIDIRL